MFLRILARASTTDASRTMFRTGLVLCLGAFLSITGCRTVDYQAAKLPAHLHPAERVDPQSVDLARLSQATGRSDRVQPGDVLKVAVNTGIEERPVEPWDLRVDDDGTVDVPLVGPVTVASLKWSEVDQAVRQVSIERGIYRDPKVAVSLEKRDTMRVTVLGAVDKPGLYELPAIGSDLVAALSAAGGLTKDAETVIEIHRPAQTGNPNAYGNPQRGAHSGVTRIDLVQASQGGAPNLILVDGSTVMVPKRPIEQVSVIGVVHKSGQYEIPPDRKMRLLDAIAQAGDRRIQFANRVSIIRQNPDGGEPIVIGASVSRARRNGNENILLAPGDVVSVDETPLTTTLETLQNVIRFGFNSAVPGI